MKPHGRIAATATIEEDNEDLTPDIKIFKDAHSRENQSCFYLHLLLDKSIQQLLQQLLLTQTMQEARA